MRYSLLFIAVILFFAACKKDKYTTTPQISFISIAPDVVGSLSASPVITIDITDAEGDIGLSSTDTAFIYIRNLLVNASDSIKFPDLEAATKKNFKAEVDFVIPNSVLKCNSLPSGALHTDTVYFEIYVKDFAKNKSNVINSTKPLYFICQ